MIPEGVYKFHSVLLHEAYSDIPPNYGSVELMRSAMRKKIQ